MPRSSHGDWEPARERRSPEAVLLEQAADRVADLVPIRHGRMLASPFAFFRGGRADGRRPRRDAAVGLAGPVCGDAHVSNFGGFASPARELVFDINDFDETARGPWEWDVKRLAASVAIAGRELGLAQGARRGAVEAAVRSYREAMRRFATMRNLELWYARLDVARILSHVGDRVSAEERKAFKRRVAGARAKDHLRAMSKLAERVDGEPRIVSRPPRIVPVEELFPASASGEIEEQMRSLLRAYRRSLPAERRRLLEGYRYRHMARRVGGVGSVGTRTWIVLLTGRDGEDPLFLQVKEAGPSVLEPYAVRDRARNHGQRVVQGQRLMQVDSDIFLGWLRAAGTDDTARDYYVRQLWDWKLGAEVELMSPARLTVFGTLCGWTLARAHALGRSRRDLGLSRLGECSTAPSRLSRKRTRTRTSATTPSWRKRRGRAASLPSAAYERDGPPAQDRGHRGLARVIPAVRWLPGYERRWLRGDLAAGITVTALVVPKNLGYADIAGVPLQNGLYAAAAGGIVYALFCTSRHISTGPSSSLAAVAGGRGGGDRPRWGAGGAAGRGDRAGDRAAVPAARALAVGVDRELPVEGGGHGIPGGGGDRRGRRRGAQAHRHVRRGRQRVARVRVVAGVAR